MYRILSQKYPKRNHPASIAILQSGAPSTLRAGRLEAVQGFGTNRCRSIEAFHQSPSPPVRVEVTLLRREGVVKQALPA